uniref:Uncharacterized protein n=1 Tax=Arundo donax TaxID=35708 RepID=A0A0A9B195_ARUDO
MVIGRAVVHCVMTLHTVQPQPFLETCN